jgi:hypothetical protein
MIYIWKSCGERITEDRCGFPKSNAMFAPVRGFFASIPLELHPRSV